MRARTCTTRTRGRGPVVMLHGNPTWSYVYRNFAAPSSANGRCAVPDYVGFGRPDKPLDLVETSGPTSVRTPKSAG